MPVIQEHTAFRIQESDRTVGKDPDGKPCRRYPDASPILFHPEIPERPLRQDNQTLTVCKPRVGRGADTHDSFIEHLQADL